MSERTPLQPDPRPPPTLPLSSTPQTVTYFAVSVLSSRTMHVGALTILIAILSLPDVLALIPLRYLPHALALSGILTMVLRKISVRPVAFIPVGEVKAVAVAKMDPPQTPPLVTD